MTENKITEIIAGLKGLAPWDIKLGVGTFLTMEFGRSETKPGRVPHGEWHLWLYMCAWRIEQQDKVLVASADDRQAIDAVLQKNLFDTVQEIKVTVPSLDLFIQFNPRIRLLTFADSTSIDAQWMLFTPDGNVLTVYGGGRLHYGSSTEPRYEPK